ncbi:hypothetical protein Ancab_014223 [Ancistrocladus abbreviatus]
MASFLLLLLLSLFSLSSLLVLSSSTANTLTTTPNTTAGVVTITLSPFPTYPSKDLWEITTHIAKSTLARAHHLKHSKSTSYPQSLHQTPLHPRSYGGYSLSLNFGTPPQSIPAVMDTGSSLIWVPCTSRYVCTNCTFPHIDPARIPTFSPNYHPPQKSSAARTPNAGGCSGRISNLDARTATRGSQTCSQLCPNLYYPIRGRSNGWAVAHRHFGVSREGVPRFCFWMLHFIRQATRRNCRVRARAVFLTLPA